MRGAFFFADQGRVCFPYISPEAAGCLRKTIRLRKIRELVPARDWSGRVETAAWGSFYTRREGRPSESRPAAIC